MIPVCRVLLLSLLLLFVQQESVVHVLQHDRARLTDTQHALHAPADDACLMCALLAGGAHALPLHATTIAVAHPAPLVVLWVGQPVATTAPSYYSSRAPPILL